MLLTTSTRAHTSFEFWVCMRFTFLHLFFLFPLPLGAKSETNFNEIPFGAWIAHAGMAKMSLPYQHIFMRKKDPLSRRLTYVRSETERSEFGISSRRSRALKVARSPFLCARQARTISSKAGERPASGRWRGKRRRRRAKVQNS